MASLVGFAGGSLGTVSDEQTVLVDCETLAAASALVPVPAQEGHRIGDYIADYSPFSSDELIDSDVDEELERMLTVSTVVRRNEGL